MALEILVVCTEARLRNKISRALQNSRAKIFFEDGRTAQVRINGGYKPGAVIIDQGSTGETHQHGLAWLRKNSKYLCGTKKILITNFDSNETRRQAKNNGVRIYYAPEKEHLEQLPELLGLPPKQFLALQYSSPFYALPPLE
jgi:DNA-binding NarL/FixJ family response regulator